MSRNNRVVVLVGAGTGPIVSAREFTEPQVRIVGLAEGGTVTVADPDGGAQYEFTSNGDHKIPASRRLQFTGCSKVGKMLCFLVGR